VDPPGRSTCCSRGRRGRSGDPFSGFLEAPPVTAALYDRHAPRFAETRGERERAYRAFLLDLTELLWGLDEARMVEEDALRRYGFDPAELEPDTDDF
jgi:hypothetical protein